MVALYVFLAPVPSYLTGNVDAILSYDVLRADCFYAGFFLAASVSIVMLYVRPSKVLLLAGAVSCMVPLLVSYAWTITQERYFGVLLATVTVPITYLSYNPWVDRFGALLAILVGAMFFTYTVRTTGRRALSVLRFFEGCSLAVIPLPLGVALFDGYEVSQPIASQLLPIPTNLEALYILSAFLAVVVYLEFGLARRDSPVATGPITS
jgi:hypothetical protein